MRLRYRAVDWFHCASRSSREERRSRDLPIPVVTDLEKGFDTFSNLDNGAFGSCDRHLPINNCSSKISLELLQDFSCVDGTSIYDKFLSQIFPSVKQFHRPSSINVGADVVTLLESLDQWFCSNLTCNLQIHETDANTTCDRPEGVHAKEVQEDDVMGCSTSQGSDTCEMRGRDVHRDCRREGSDGDAIAIYSRSQGIDISKIHKVDLISGIYDNVQCSSLDSGKSIFGPHPKEQRWPKSIKSAFQEIEAPLLELQSGIPRSELVSLFSPWQHCLRIISDLGTAPLTVTAPETNEEAAVKGKVPQAWFALSALSYSPRLCHNNDETAVEKISKQDIDSPWEEWLSKMSNPIVKITPIEVLMISEKLYWLPGSQKETTYPLEPGCLLQVFESNGDKLSEKQAESLPLGLYSTEITLVDFSAPKLAYHDAYPQLKFLLPGLLCDQRDFRPCCSSASSPAVCSFLGTKLTFEIPRVYDWSSTSQASQNPGIIAADEAETEVPDLPRLRPLQSFDSSVVIPELNLDDHQFQSLPVPAVTGPQDDRIDALGLGRLMSFNCEYATFPATHSLYLDWHFFHGLKCTNAICFSLRAQLTEDARCPLLPSPLVTRGIQNPHICSDFELKLRLLEDRGFHRDPCPKPHATKTVCHSTEAFLPSPLAGVFQRRDNEAFPPPMKAQKRAYEPELKPLPQTPSVNIRAGIDKATANGLSSARHASNVQQDQRSSGAVDRNVDRQVQKFGTNPVSKRRRHDLQNLTPVEIIDFGKLDSLRTLTSQLESHCNFQEENLSNKLSSRREVSPTSSPTSIPKSSDFMENFNFFVKARKGIADIGFEPQMTKAPKQNGCTAVVADVNEVPNHIYATEPTLSCEASELYHDCTPAAPPSVHQIEPSLEIRKGMRSLSSNYRALLSLDEMSELKNSGAIKVLEQFGFDDDVNSHLTAMISDMASEPASPQRQTLLRGLISLHVLRHAALNLCEYGIQVAHLYLENCFERMPFLEGHIMDSRTELEEAYNRVEAGAVEDHPKLCYLDKILRPEALEINPVEKLPKKILLLADRRAFFSVVRKLVSLGLTPYQIDRKENYLRNGVLQEEHMKELREEIVEALAFSDCLLVSYVYITSTFPWEGFTMIIHYADPPSMDGTNRNWTRGGCEIHFLKLLVHLEDFQEICSGSTSQRQGSHYQDPQAHSFNGSNPLLHANADGLSRDQPIGQSSSLSKDSPQYENEPPRSSSFGRAKEQLLVEDTCTTDRRCEMIIVANISHPNDHLLTGRRSSFQKILHLEKDNVLVVERELRLPVDLILSPASCLLIYTLGKLKLEPNNLQNKRAELQNVVVTHLKAISFSFRDCIMIFEGPTEFTTLALNIFTHIYALAISLEMQFQCFASRHQEVTDRIVMQSIQAVRRSRRMLSCPMMTEGPTLAEVFLTEFPSINPLAAHAILSSGCTLPVFMSYSPEQQFAAVEDYEVPRHGLDLFKAQCSYKAKIALIKNTRKNTVPDCKGGKSQQQRADDEPPPLHQEDPQAASMPHRSPAPEVWASFPEFPPASAISDYSTAYSDRNTNKISNYSPAYNGGVNHEVGGFSPAYNNVMMAPLVDSFPDFPSISEVRDCEVADPGENEPSCPDMYEVIDILKHGPAEAPGMDSAARWSQNLDADKAFRNDGAAPQHNNYARGSFEHPHEIYAHDDILWSGKGVASAGLGSGRPLCGEQSNGLNLPQNSSSAACYEVEDGSFGLKSGHWPPETSPEPIERCKRPRGGSASNHGRYDIFLKSGAEIAGLGGIPRPQNRLRPVMDDSRCVGAKRGTSSFSSISPASYCPTYGSREEMSSDTALGSWNDHKRVRGVAGDFMKETFDLLQESNFTSNLAPFPACFDESSAVRADWQDNPTSVHEEANASFMSGSMNQQHSRPPPTPTTLKASHLDRFRHQTRRAAGAPGTASNSYTKAKTKYPRKPAPARGRGRTHSESVTYIRPANIAKAAFAKKALSDNIAIDMRSEAILGYARRGSDTQQCLVWKTTPSSASSKRQRTDAIR